MALRVLFPVGASCDEALANLRPACVPDDRPYVLANMITTVDGTVTIDGVSGPLGPHAPGDRPLFRLLRDHSDAVLAGSGTLVAEQYKRLIPTAERRAERAARGLAPDALSVVLSPSGRLPDGVPLLDDPEQPRRIFVGEQAEPSRAFAQLRHDGVRVLLCEGGPHLLGDLIRRELVDELFVTFAPVVTGGDAARTLLAGPADHTRALTLRSLLEERGGLHARYAMLAPTSGSADADQVGALPPR